MKKIFGYALINATGTALYVIAIASLIYSLGNSVPTVNKSVLIPIAMLMLFVFSAAFTGLLVLGRPLMWYLDGKKKEAFSLLVYTLGIFLVLTLLVFFILITLVG